MDIKIVNIYKAHPIGGLKLQSIHIEILQEVSESLSFKQAQKLYAQQAKDLADALFDTLPGGTIDGLLIEMLDRKRSLLRVKFEG